MFNAPKFSRHFKVKDPDDVRGTYGKIRGLRGRGFFGKSNAHEPAKNAPKFLSYLVLFLSVGFGVGILSLNLGAIFNWRDLGGYAGFLILVFIGLNLIFVVTESLGGRELRFRGAFVMCTWGAMTLSLIIGVVIGLLT